MGFISFDSKVNVAGNLIMIIVSLELILLAIGILLINISIGLDDMVGVNLTLYLLPLAGAESAIALALLVAYYPLRGNIVLNITSSMSSLVLSNFTV
ncbi:hypothetical protein HDU92_000960 [Lobulomyces angularis]|nr:hypothetical protein HDU92_000960 [Lobulomyces angularis]